MADSYCRALSSSIKRGLSSEEEDSNSESQSLDLPIESAMVREFVSEERINKHYYEEAMKILAPAEQLASEAGVRFTAKTLAGTPAQKIAECVDTEHCDHIVMGTRGLGNLGNLVLGSIATKVIHLVDVPVTVVK